MRRNNNNEPARREDKSMQKSAVTGAITLLTEYDESGNQEVRSLRLEPAADGKAVLLIEIDERKPGIHREVRYEITPAELIAAIRAHGAELPGEQHNR
jgi:Mrp family chromosome partitioning ATPase